MRTLSILVVAFFLNSSVMAVEPQAILNQTNNLRAEVLELAFEAYEQAEVGGHVR